MIRGTVTDQREVVVVIEVEDATGGLHPVPVVVDTGFDGSLTLPEEAMKELSASRIGRG